MTKLSDLGEFGLIGRIEKAFRNRSQRAPLGIGDDAAALIVSPGKRLLATTDMLLEGVHFDLATTDLYSLGWKSAAVNLSDIAAMGGIPRSCLTSIGIPEGVSAEQVGELYRGFKAMTRKHGVELVGGDTCASDVDLVISVTVLGEVERNRMLTRSGARPGDRIFVSGPLGDSAAGLELMNAGTGGRDPDAQRLTVKHLRPSPRVELGRRLALSGCVSAMIDISDGLAADLGHVCGQSGVGAEIHVAQLPISLPLRRIASSLQCPLLRYALCCGEDYELLFTVPQKKLRRFRSLRPGCHEIGGITAGRKLILNNNGRRFLLRPSGYDHFRSHT